MEPNPKLCRLCRLLLQKFAPTITEKERRTIGQVKALLDSGDMTIQSLVGQFQGPGYTFDSDYLTASKKALLYVSLNIDFVKLDIPISFWLSPKEIVENKIADDEDHAVFLCTLLLALGDANAEVVIAEMTDLTTHAFVLSQYRGLYYLFDSTQENASPLNGTKEEIFSQYVSNGSRIKRFLYKFNHSNYEQFL